MLTVKTVEPAQAIQWIKQGWFMFRANPVIWALLGVLFGSTVLLLSMLPFIGGLLLNVAIPVLIGGMLLAVKQAHTSKAVEVADALKVLKDVPIRNQLMLVGAIMLGASFAATLLGKLLVGDLIMMDDITGLPSLNLNVSMLVFLLMISLGTGMLFTYAPALVVFKGMTAMDAVKASFHGAWTNALPFVVFALIYAGLTLLAAIPLMLGFVVLIPVMVGAVYMSYKDIFE
ncbi:MAG: hypothetical protein RL122_1452 [Pseudomonadota bacterium]|jgi:uncharacterized membrane protein|uniref:Transmembrane protein n=1 Tax=Thiothrix fructosivorans TaxID=111770 RepID=A0A8B0SFW6_9GAMM|nr:BPSS1780 family membrane protein [Thiothrix fructosivorans]MBO0614481.1 hypothetical protein [Thiothrix fructosivorans]QTX09320.1 hypothetical protein J1836_011775 [Thiothrix fructosivorans]